MSPEQWERVLLAATSKVKRRVSSLSRRGERGRAIGIGASGDRTLQGDKVAEDVILSALARAGKVRVLSEEAGMVGDPRARALAVVDPVDGSANFARRIPFYCTSVALAEGGSLGDIIVGVVRDLVTGEVYSAVKGKGSRKNGRPIKTSAVAELSSAVVGVDLSRGGKGTAELLAPLIASAGRQVHLGANALELCYVAEGKTDAFVDIRGRIRVTDFAAAYLIAAEAGAEISKPDGGELKARFDLSGRYGLVVSGNEGLHKQILDLVRRSGGVGPG